MVYSLIGFPVDLIWGILIAFLIKPKINVWLVVTVTIIMMIPGYFIPQPYQVSFWAPGGAATIITGTSIIAYSLVNEAWFKGKKTDLLPERKTVREALYKFNSTEDRQQEYIIQIQKISIAYENNNNSILLANTLFYLFAFVTLFCVDFTAITIIHINNPDLIKTLFFQVYQNFVVNPGTFEAWFSDIIKLGALHIFIFNIVIFMILYYVIGQVLKFRKISLPLVGNLSFFHMPFYSLWAYILSATFFLVTLKFNYGNLPLYVAKNLFFIFSTLYIFQGISIFWLFLQVRLLPAGAIVVTILVFAFLFQLLSVFIFSFFVLLGLLDFWFDFRKKALHPNLLTDDV